MPRQASATDRHAIDLDDRVAAVYGGPLGAFVAERDALARDLRAAGRRDDAAAVKALRKPRVVAWALDAGARADPGAIAGLAAAVEALRGAQTGGADLRAAIADLRAAEGPVVDAATRAARDHGQPVDRTALASAVRAVVGDPQALAALRTGRLVDVPAAGGLGVPPSGAPAAPATRSGTARAERPGGERRAAAPERDAARRAVAAAERDARDAAEAAGRAARAAEEAAETARRLREEADAAHRRADEAADAAERARQEATARAAARDAAEATLERARAALRGVEA
ncbi:MAG TPA: hypothetical protein VFZ77_24050 [Acidimicrobiales bacterium]